MAKKTTKVESKKDTSETEVNSSQSKILKDLAKRLSDDNYSGYNYSNQENGDHQDPEIKKINRIIQKSAQEISEKADQKSDKKDSQDSKPSFSPANFDGVSGPSEEKTLMSEKTKHLERENLKLKHQLELLQEDFQKEKADLKKTVRDLRGEIHRTAPLNDNKLFHFSRELRHIAGTVQALSDGSVNSDSSFSNHNNPDENLTDLDPITPNPITSSSSTTPDQVNSDKPKQVINPDTDNEKSKTDKQLEKNSKKKKTIIASTAIASALIVVVTGVLLSRQPKANQEIIDSYLNQNGEVQGASDNNTDQTTPPKKKEQKDNQVSFEDTVWETYRDEFLGFQVKYPGNATDLLHTGGTTTFLRKDGYIFKMQRVFTDKTLDEYWQETQDDGLKYEVEKTTLWFNDAIHLKLIEDIEYPGNRYLVKSKEHIFDLWYATPSQHFDEDDIKRVEYMLDSVKFLD